MAFVDEKPTRRIENPPGEEGQWFEIKELSWKEIEECKREKARAFVGRMREMGPEMLEAINKIEQTNPKAVEEARAENDRAALVDSFDRATLVQKSVTGWSYERTFKSKDLDKLTPDTFDWLFGEIVKLYVGDDAQRKGDSESSMTS